MSKLFEDIEQIFRFRLLSNSDIPAYMRRMSSIGKIDEVRRQALLVLMLNKLGELEDAQRAVIAPVSVVNTGELVCGECGFVAKSSLGLLSHSNKHKIVV